MWAWLLTLTTPMPVHCRVAHRPRSGSVRCQWHPCIQPLWASFPRS